MLATLATIIASEAVIAGAFTVLHQAGGLGLFPYLRTRTRLRTRAGGSTYQPPTGAWPSSCLLIVVVFRSSDRLAAAYGVAVAATILVTVTALPDPAIEPGPVGPRLRQAVACSRPPGHVGLLRGATLRRSSRGGWVPVGIGVVLFLVMWTWWSGRHRLAAARREAEGTPDEVLHELILGESTLHRVPGTAVFLTIGDVAPFALRTTIEAEQLLPEHVVLLSWQVEDTPQAPAHEAVVDVDRFGDRYEGVVGGR